MSNALAEVAPETRRPSAAPDANTVFQLLSVDRRRRALDYLYAGEGLDMAELTDELTAHECGPEYDSAERKRVYIGLYQQHLPSMKDAGAVEYESVTGTIRPGPHIGDIYACLETVRGRVSDGRLRLRNLLPTTSTINASAESVCSLLSSRRRTLAVEVAATFGRWRKESKWEFAKHAAAEEYGESIDELSEKQIRRVSISLYQNHYDILADSDVLDWDGETISRGKYASDYATLLRDVRNILQEASA